jgi:aminoglycoside phosphotransferase (APT) family kinase protein
MDKAQAIVGWIEANLGKVSDFRSQERWRSAWFATLEREGERLPIYIRGDRDEAIQAGRLGLEAAVTNTLLKHGLPAPKVYGLCAEPAAMVMERCPGRHNLATAVDEQERVSVLEHLGEIMARMHLIDPADAEAAGVPRPVDMAHAVMPYLLENEAKYRQSATPPEPKIEFLLGWLHRNAPRDCDRLSLIAQDAGQFLFEQGRVTAMLDFELACIADPMIDIAALRQRAVSEPMGDLRPALRRYVEVTGWQLDRRRIAFHTAAWQVGVSVVMTPILLNPGPDVNFPEYLAWYALCMRAGIQGMGEFSGYELPTRIEAPPARPSRWGAAHAQLVERVGQDLALEDGYPNRLKHLTAQLVANIDRYGAWAEGGYIADIAELTGSRPSSWQEADDALGAFLPKAGPDHDRPIIELLNRWALRQERLVEGLNSMGEERMMPLDELLDL